MESRAETQVSSKYYGWIGKIESNGKRMRGERTNTAAYIMYFMEKCGKELETGIKRYDGKEYQTRNLMIDKNEKYYYILCIGKNKTSWAAYPFVDDIIYNGNIHLLLTIDGKEEGTGTLYCIKLDVDNWKQLKSLVERTVGEYYSIAKTNVDSMVDITKKTYTWLDENADNYICKILGKIVGESQNE